MRGSRSLELRPIMNLGIIPAHAGLTRTMASRPGSSWDHPRACGAHLARPLKMPVTAGSSPRMRGSHISIPIAMNPCGIIPAHAGLTSVMSIHSSLYGDHPRACGAHASGAQDEQYFWGSSPRMRGSQIAASRATTSPGIIPAHAGLTVRTLPAHHAARDHPRACGAHTYVHSQDAFQWGSSPRMRGSLRASCSTI